MGRARWKNSLQKKKAKLRSTSSLMSHQVSGASVNVTNETKDASDSKHDTVAASGSVRGKELAIYDESFARRQILQHSCTCAVCQKKGYFMKTCYKCWTSRYCRGKCLKAHRKGFNQKEMCACHAAFNGARASISLKLKQSLFSDGYIEITSHLYSVPRSEIQDEAGQTHELSFRATEVDGFF